MGDLYWSFVTFVHLYDSFYIKGDVTVRCDCHCKSLEIVDPKQKLVLARVPTRFLHGVLQVEAGNAFAKQVTGQSEPASNERFPGDLNLKTDVSSGHALLKDWNSIHIEIHTAPSVNSLKRNLKRLRLRLFTEGAAWISIFI